MIDIRRVIFIIVLVLLQVLLFNHIQLFGCITPLFYVVFILSSRRTVPLWQNYLLSFCLGVFVDCFMNTPGVAALSCLTLSAIQPRLFSLFLSKDAARDTKPSITTMGRFSYIVYSSFLVLLYCIMFFSLTVFSLWGWHEWIVGVIGSFVLTMALVLLEQAFE